MATFSYLCPNTGQRVHVRLPPTMRPSPSVMATTCPACQHLHFLNSSGKVQLAHHEFTRRGFRSRKASTRPKVPKHAQAARALTNRKAEIDRSATGAAPCTTPVPL